MPSSSKNQPFRSCSRRSNICAPLNRGFVKKATWGALRAQEREFVRQMALDLPKAIHRNPSTRRRTA